MDLQDLSNSITKMSTPQAKAHVSERRQVRREDYHRKKSSSSSSSSGSSSKKKENKDPLEKVKEMSDSQKKRLKAYLS